MIVKTIAAHLGEGSFPTFASGTAVEMGASCQHFLHWSACEIDGYQTYVPDVFVEHGYLNQDYNPTELVAEPDELMEVLQVVHAWLLVRSERSGKVGWMPAENVVSV
ncbi:hypothetical protein [Culicoidibacter larvae]|uniref:SH3 domain-containing protein n=1 Tax=Culicoidibacter larvae TaxID=2579976 RepID=A0A5R8Q7U9_9FIRM|nr:hypothetical protein [Culicoidibacter larvae]TLG71211.1 hypothetical protein FEZ08_11190 [Culicoidibacter larvae]